LYSRGLANHSPIAEGNFSDLQFCISRCTAGNKSTKRSVISFRKRIVPPAGFGGSGAGPQASGGGASPDKQGVDCIVR
jgi:hypothetical protein